MLFLTEHRRTSFLLSSPPRPSPYCSSSAPYWCMIRGLSLKSCERTLTIKTVTTSSCLARTSNHLCVFHRQLVRLIHLTLPLKGTQQLTAGYIDLLALRFLFCLLDGPLWVPGGGVTHTLAPQIKSKRKQTDPGIKLYVNWRELEYNSEDCQDLMWK